MKRHEKLTEAMTKVNKERFELEQQLRFGLSWGYVEIGQLGIVRFCVSDETSAATLSVEDAQKLAVWLQRMNEEVPS